MRVLILANGEPPTGEFARRLAAEHDWLLATDGAANTCERLGLQPDVISGDFDSVRMEEAAAWFPNAEWIPTPDQDLADLEKAVQIACERGATEITVLGATGGRWDHTLTAFALLVRYHEALDICLRDERATCRAVGRIDGEETRVVQTAPGDTISLINQGIGGRVTISGVHWPLDDFALPVGTQGVSNIVEAETVIIRVSGGVVLLVHVRQKSQF